jgi:hypothetical protein
MFSATYYCLGCGNAMGAALVEVVVRKSEKVESKRCEVVCLKQLVALEEILQHSQKQQQALNTQYSQLSNQTLPNGARNCVVGA